MGNFAYPNLLSGTRTGKGWTRTGGTGVYDPNTGITLGNSKRGECWLYSPDVVLHTGRTYTLSFYAASTANMAGCDIFVLDGRDRSDGYQWVGAAKMAFNPPAGGHGPHGHSPSPRVRGMARHSRCASTTTARRTETTRWSGSATSCSANRTCRVRGLRGRTMIGADAE